MHEHVSGIWKGTHRKALPENRTVCLSASETTRDRGETCVFPKSYPSSSCISCARLGDAFQT